MKKIIIKKKLIKKYFYFLYYKPTHLWHRLGAPELISLLHGFLLRLGRFVLYIKNFHGHFNVLYRYIYSGRCVAVLGSTGGRDSSSSACGRAHDTPAALNHQLAVILRRRRVRRLILLLSVPFLRALQCNVYSFY